MTHESKTPTIGSLFAGIGGFDLGFEQAGWRTEWQVEIDELNRAVLADRFPHARRFADINHVTAEELGAVDCITFGFPCTDISTQGNTRKGRLQGLRGERSGLFWKALALIRALQPAWIVAENVPNLLHIADGRDFAAVLQGLRDCGYVGLWRVLDAQGFGSPGVRRRVFVVAGRRRMPPASLLFDAAPVEPVSSSYASCREPWAEADEWPGHTLQAFNATSRIAIGSELLIAEENGWSAMVERQRSSEVDGLCAGLDEINTRERWSAGNAVSPYVARWIAEALFKEAAHL